VYNARGKTQAKKEFQEEAKMNKKIKKALEKIAMEESYTIEVRGGLDTRDNDEDDFKEISVTALQRMLERAYQLGKNSK